MQSTVIAPSILSANFARLGEQGQGKPGLHVTPPVAPGAGTGRRLLPPLRRALQRAAATASFMRLITPA